MIIKFDDLEKIKKNHIGKTIVSTNGAFDMFHYGHLKALKFAKSQGDILVVGLNSDKSVKCYKSENRPIVPEKQRSMIIDSLKMVDFVYIFDEPNPINFLEALKPDIHVKGIEHKNNMVEGKTVIDNNGKIIFMERDPEDVSTSQIIARIKNET